MTVTQTSRQDLFDSHRMHCTLKHKKKKKKEEKPVVEL